MRTLLLWPAVLTVLSVLSTPALSAHAASGASASTQQAIVERQQMYGGYRGKAGEQVKPLLVESCFKQKTGYYPYQLGLPLYPPGYDWYFNPDRY